MGIINWDLISHPANWIIIALMWILALFAFHEIGNLVGANQQQKASS